MKYVECKHTALLRCKYKDALGTDASIDFYPFVLDKYTGQPRYTGFTEVEDSVLEALTRDSNVFKSFLKKKLLNIVDALPSSAQTASALLAAKEKEVFELKSKLAERDKQIDSLKKSLAIQQEVNGKAEQADASSEDEPTDALSEDEPTDALSEDEPTDAPVTKKGKK